ncbi:uncharacterized protein MAM_00569 [Metarhizium album ARSEF 1941]|uniref:C2H2 zinc finger protein n=1 Tax=Metarhizium album (strain ARSEF 1941) TaxID=1081103 RepID=A0A0B2X713_METAS|nr:uncharacterized protein MAM_00569 [Metarhizium album ARSEF 1941]KHO01568.1 hypothetical protein MAM_00569 [Metarhizium album ARSEF 1941]
MGNSNTKESRSEHHDGSSDPRECARSRNRISRGDLGGFLSLQPPRDRGRDRHDAPFEHRETRQEREARRLEKERQTRAKDRERSIREEHVDGGYLVTMGTYTGTEDFSKPVVRQLQVCLLPFASSLLSSLHGQLKRHESGTNLRNQIERKLAPFWRGLNDWSENWTEHQLVAAARGLPIPDADAPPDPDLMPRPSSPQAEAANAQGLQSLTVPMGPRTLSAASDRSGSGAGSGISSPTTAAPPKSSSIKPRAKALAAALSVGSRSASSTDLAPKEVPLPRDPFVNGQPIEVYLYKDASECPICFLSYPPYLNRTRCCDQPICSECFVQIKRADPHLPERHPNGETRDPNEGPNPEDPPEMLISEPSACPYCQQPEFGVTYEPPSFRRGVAYSTYTNFASTAMSSQSSLNSTLSPATPQPFGRRRTHSLSATAPNVITTDRVRPDWATKLASARAHQARRAAAATALHTAAFLVGAQESRSILRPSRFGRRSAGTDTPVHDHTARNPGEAEADPDEMASSRNAGGIRRSRMDELEDMMFMEAVRLSLATEEERKRKEEKALRKEAKKRQQAEKKAQKKASKDPYGGSISGASRSSLSLGLGRRRGNSGASALRAEATTQGASQATKGEEPLAAETETMGGLPGKGKAVDRGSEDITGAGSSAAASLPIAASRPHGSSHLRQMSNASSLGSSLADTPSGSYTGPGFSGADGTGSRSEGDRDTGSEPMFNFRSLAELVGVNIDDGSADRSEGEASSNLAKDTTRRLLSQVQDEKAGSEADHAEKLSAGQAGEEEKKPQSTLSNEPTAVETLGATRLSPEVTITPKGDDVDSSEAKQPD